uniref:PAS domain-containing protein n=1 Tax=Pseudictyota dubia TaxID=2749911 RepID=A0A7R9WB99_9STRA
MTYYQQGSSGAPGPAPTLADGSQPQQTSSPPQQQQQQQSKLEPQLVTHIDDHEYRFVFNSCSVGMAIASMGGAFIDCNSLFCQLSQYTKQEVCAMTIFNLTSRQDLQHAFDLISKMISPPPDGSSQNPPPCVLRGAMKHRNDLGLSIALIKGEDGIAKCFCVTLIKNPASPFDTSRPIPATADFLQTGGMQLTSISDQAQKTQSSGSLSSPAYTTG